MKSRLGIVEAPSIGCERIYQRHSRLCKVSGVAGDDRQVLHQRNCGDLLIEFVIGVGNAQPAPNLCGIRVEDENILGESMRSRQPRFENRCLSGIVPISDQLDAAVKFADGYRRYKDRFRSGGGLLEEAENPWIGVRLLAQVAHHIGINQTHAGAPIEACTRAKSSSVPAAGIAISTSTKAASSGRTRGGQDSPVLGLGAATMFVRPFHERPDDVVIDIPYQQVRHLTSPAGCHLRAARKAPVDRPGDHARRGYAVHQYLPKPMVAPRVSVDEGTAANAPLC